jgi:hypothetical protein
VDDLAILLERTLRIVDQTRLRLSGTTPPGATRLVSLHDPDARPIKKGRLGKPVEFGFKAQMVDNIDGIVLDCTVEVGNPPDAPMLAPAVERVIDLTGQSPSAVAADRGYGETDTMTTSRASTSTGSPSPARASRRRPAAGPSPPSGSASWSSGAPEPKGASPASSATSTGPAPCLTASTAHEPGAATACSSTTSSISPPPHSPIRSGSTSRRPRRVVQVEVVSGCVSD